MEFRPLHDRVLVKRVEQEEKTAGGIIIPDTAQEKPMEGEIIAVGTGSHRDDGTIMPLDVKAAIASCSASGPAPRSRSTVKTV